MEFEIVQMGVYDNKERVDKWDWLAWLASSVRQKWKRRDRIRMSEFNKDWSDAAQVIMRLKLLVN